MNMDEKRNVQVQLVDNEHARWTEVVEAIDHLGQRDRLHTESDGWLTSRHSLLVAFSDNAVAGHLSFRVQPVRADNGQPLTHLGRPMVEAKLESLGVQPGFSRDEIEAMLREAAERRAMLLRCRQLVGFN